MTRYYFTPLSKAEDFFTKEHISWQEFCDIWGDVPSEKLLHIDEDGKNIQHLFDVMTEEFKITRKLIPLLLQGKKRGRTKEKNIPARRIQRKTLEESMHALITEHEKLIRILNKIPEPFFETKTSISNEIKDSTLVLYERASRIVKNNLHPERLD